MLDQKSKYQLCVIRTTQNVSSRGRIRHQSHMVHSESLTDMVIVWRRCWLGSGLYTSHAASQTTLLTNSYSMLNVESALRPLLLENKSIGVLRGTWGTSTKRRSSALKQPHKKESLHSSVLRSPRGSAFNEGIGFCTFPEQRCIYLISTSSCTSPPLPPYISPHLFLLYHALKCGLSFFGFVQPS